jgi:hypothetical protein
MVRSAAIAVVLLLPVHAALAQNPDQAPVAPPLPAQDDAAAAAAPPPLPAEAEYFVEEQRNPVGPLTLQAMKERVKAGITGPSDLVWKKGTAGWAAAETFAELRTGDVPPPIPGETRFRDYMVGTWQTTSEMQGLSTTTMVRYDPNGTYAGVVTTTALGTNQTVSRQIAGTWSVASIREKQFALTLKERNSPSVNTAQMRIVDENTLDLEGTGMQAVRTGR